MTLLKRPSFWFVTLPLLLSLSTCDGCLGGKKKEPRDWNLPPFGPIQGI